MPNYAKQARDRYESELSKNKVILVETVWEGIKKHAQVSRIAEKATIAFLELVRSKNDWIEGVKIIGEIGLKHYKFNQSYGLWPWLERRNGADLIIEKGDWPDTSYKIRDEFYDVMKKVIS
jgi:hypothetical protein